MQQRPDGSNLTLAFGIFRRRWFWVPICVVLAAGAAFGISKGQPTRYTATASLLFKSNAFTQEIAGLLPANLSPQAEQSNNVKLVEFGDIAAKTATGLGLSQQHVSESVSVAEQGEPGFAGESSVVDVSASTGSPTLSADIANTYVAHFVKEQQESNSRYFRSALSLVTKQLAALPRAQRFGANAATLQNRAQSLRLLAELQYNGVQLGRAAVPPASPTSPKISRNTAIGALLGLFVGIGLMFLLEHLDRRIREPETLEELYGAPLLGVVRDGGSLARVGSEEGSMRTALSPVEAETFSLILAHVRSRNPTRDLRTVLVVSAGAGDGKTTVALRLAESAASAGARVLLLEANLRRPTLARQLSIRGQPSLKDVLTNAVPLAQATQAVQLQTGSGDRAPVTLDVLTAGDENVLNAGEMIESDAIDAALRSARSSYDLVVIDTPPLTAVSDAFPLLRKVDGVIMVASVGRNRSDVAARLSQILASSGVPLLGVVANRAESTSPGFFGSDAVDGYHSARAASTVVTVVSPADERSTAATP